MEPTQTTFFLNGSATRKQTLIRVENSDHDESAVTVGSFFASVNRPMSTAILCCARGRSSDLRIETGDSLTGLLGTHLDVLSSLLILTP